MTPEEYAAKELNVPGFENEEPLYAPGSNPSEQDPNIAIVMNGGRAEPEPAMDPEILAIQKEYNLTLPLELKRAELETEKSKANFWNSLATLLTSLVN